MSITPTPEPIPIGFKMYMICKRCNGTGKVIQTVDPEQPPQEIVCPNCGGAGELQVGRLGA